MCSLSDAVGMSTIGDSGPPASATNLLIDSAVSPPPSTISAPDAGPTLGRLGLQNEEQRKNRLVIMRFSDCEYTGIGASSRAYIG